MKKVKPYIYAHNPNSCGAAALSAELVAKRIRHIDSKYTPRDHHVVINWGGSFILPYILHKGTIINDVGSVALASDKLAYFRAVEYSNTLAGNKVVPIPPWTEDIGVAEGWIGEGKTVVCRTLLNASGGKGIVLVDKKEDLVDAPLYVQYIPKKEEYRVHIVNGKVIHVQRKARLNTTPDQYVDWRIRNMANGFIFAFKDNKPIPPKVIEAGLNALRPVSLDFGAVDVIWNEKKQEAYVLEVNTAPGLTGTTVTKYAEAFKEGWGL